MTTRSRRLTCYALAFIRRHGLTVSRDGILVIDLAAHLDHLAADRPDLRQKWRAIVRHTLPNRRSNQ